MYEKHYYVARMPGHGFLGFDGKTLRWCTAGIFDVDLIKYETNEPQALERLVWGGVAEICEYADLLPTMFRIEILTVRLSNLPDPCRCGRFIDCTTSTIVTCGKTEDHTGECAP